MDEEKDKIKKMWNKDAYYKCIEDCQNAGGEESRFFISRIAEVINKNGLTNILDFGAGEGSTVNHLAGSVGEQVQFVGIDVAEVGLERARNRGIKNASFQIYDGKTIPYPDETFDLSLSTFVFEHLADPEAAFVEMSRVTKKDGFIIIVCPNYGSPFFRSPCNKENKLSLMIKRLGLSLLSKNYFKNSFKWQKVEPIVLAENEHIMDYDTTIEPNLLFFIKHIKNKPFKIVAAYSGWDAFNYHGFSFPKRIFFSAIMVLSKLNLAALKYGGPFFFVVLQK